MFVRSQGAKVAHGVIAARIGGDDFQGRLFWKYAAMLFMPGRRVARVRIECDECGAVDDLVVDFDPFHEDGGTEFVRAYIQCKFHVSGAKVYSSSALCDPSFFGTKKSFLARAYDAFRRLSSAGENVAIVLASNGAWDPTDKLKNAIADGGALRKEFLVSGPRSDLGKIRLAWCKHLGVDEAVATPFLRSLRLDCGMLNHRELLESIDVHLQLVGLLSIDSARSHNSYDAVYRELIKNGEVDFDRQALTRVCVREGLGTPKEHLLRPMRLAGIRSFMRSADYMDMECDPFVCLCEWFDGRAIRDPSMWNGEVASTLREWCAVLASAKDDLELRLESHASIAFAAGCFLGPRTTSRILPAQGSAIGGIAAWAPSSPPPRVALACRDVVVDQAGGSIGVVLAVTHDLTDAVVEFVQGRRDLDISTLRIYSPADGPGRMSVPDGPHAWAISEAWSTDIMRFIDSRRPKLTHVFSAAPNALNFLMGRHRRPRDSYQTWEHNWDGSLAADYVEAIRIQ